MTYLTRNLTVLALATALIAGLFASTATYVRADETEVPPTETSAEPVVSEEPVAPTEETVVEEVPIEEVVVEEPETPATEETVAEESVPEVLGAESASETTSEETPAPAPAQTPTLSTDKDDYHPGNIATIFGNFFAPLTDFIVKVFGSDDNDQNYTETEVTVTSDENGSFSTQYQLDNLYRPFYEVFAYSLGGEELAKMWFRDAAIAKYDQCSNDDGDGYATGNTECRFINGNLQSNNSTYFEGDSTIQRASLDGLAPGSVHTITFKYGTTKGGHHAYDYLTTWNASENWSSLTDRCDGIQAGCTTASESTAPMQDDPNATNTIEPDPASRLFTMRGGTITNVSVPQIASGSYAGDSETVVTLTYTVGPSNGSMCTTKKVQGQDETTCAVVIWFGAHIAKTSEWQAFNGTTGAGSISGSPYHVALADFDGDTTSLPQGGGRDNQMSATAIIQTSSITIIKDAVPNDAQDFSFTTTGTGLSNFSLDDDANGTLSNTQTFTGLSAGTYTVTEGAVGGWSVTAINCVDPTTNTTVNLGSRSASINLAAGESVTCTFENTLQTGHIVVVKDAVPNDAQNFTFTNNFGNGNPASFDLDDDADGTLSNSRDSVVTAGTYSVSEGAVSGWTQTSASCSDGSPVNAVQVSPGETVTCTFTNTKHGSLTIVKNTVGGNGTFNFTVGGGLVPATPQITTVGNTGSVTYNNVVPGKYSAAETVPGGWDLTSATCDSGETIGDIDVGAGEHVTCTFTNTKKGSITIEKQTLPDGDPATFSFTGDVSGTLSDGQTATVEVTPGTYTSVEGAKTGWDLAGITCDDSDSTGNVGTRTATFQVAAGENVKCTFLNTKRAHIIIDKVTNPSGDSQSFNFTAGGVGYANFSLTDAAAPNDQEVVPGKYSVSEVVPEGWDLTSATCDSGETIGDLDVGAGETVTCTFTNTKDSKIIVNKVTVGGDANFFFSSEYDPDGWTLSNGQSNDSGDIDAGTYLVNETVPEGWDQTSATCDDGSDPASINLAAGEVVTCTFTNTKKPTLTLLKTVVKDNGGTAVDTDWTLSALGPNNISGVEGAAAVTNAIVEIGSYDLSESGGPSGYAASDWVCTGGTQDDGDTVTLAAGENATCTITNDDIAPKLHLRKVVVNDNGGTKTLDDFTLTANGAGSNDLSGTSPVDSGAGLLADTWALSETEVAGYTASDWICVGGTQNGSNITVGIGGEATCTITNDDQQAYITVVKVVTNDNGGSAAPDDFALTLEGNPVLSGVAVPVNPGTYTAGETLVPGYTFEGFSGDCNENGDTTVALGESKTCTLKNNDNQSYIIVDKTVVNDHGGTAGANDFLLTVDGSAVSDEIAYPVNPGVHTAGETLLAGYAAGAWGGDCNVNGSVTVALGETKTCTITNDDIAPTLKLVKTVTNDNGGTSVENDWDLTASGFAGFTESTPETDDATARAVQAGITYNLSELGPEGYAAGNWSCDGGQQNGASITLGLDEDVTCTINNDDIAPTLKLVKEVVADNGGNEVADDWTLTASGVEGFNNLGGSGVFNTVRANEEYTLSESSVAGYDASSWECDGGVLVGNKLTLGLDEDVTCTITNDDQSAHVILIKDVITDNGGTAGVDDFGLSVGGASVASGDDTEVDANTPIALNEVGLAGYSFVSITGDEKCPEVLGGTVTLDEGETVTCTITNNDDAPSLTLVKEVINDHGGTAVSGDWTLTASGYDAASPDAGTYNLSESGPTGYVQTSLTCDNAQGQVTSVTLGLGEDVTCTFVNNDIAPRLTVIKHVVNDNGGTAVAGDFTMNVTGTEVSDPSFPGEEAPGTTVTLDAGNYSVDEGNASGYLKTLSADCSGTIGIGEEKTCTITNNDTPGHFTGGGSVFPNVSLGAFLSGVGKNPKDSRVTHGFTLHCDASRLPNRLEVNWGPAKGAQKFHLLSLATASCSDNPSIDPQQPNADFDTIEGTGTGRFNNVDGATVWFRFDDAGEPGKNDRVWMRILDKNGTEVLDTGNNGATGLFINVGNQQAHQDN